MKEIIDEKCNNNKKILKELHRLKCQQHYFEKVNGANKILEKLSSNNPLAKQILARFEISKNNRIAETMNYRNMLTKLNDMICNLRTDVIYDENLQKNDLQYYKSNILNIENEIKSFKSKIQGELETITPFNFQDLDNLITRLRRKVAISKESNEKSIKMAPSKLNIPKIDKKHTSNHNTSLEPSGVHNGNWTSEEHATFLRAKQKHKDNIQAVIKAIQKVMPDMSEKEIMAHNDWYKKYETLREQQRAVIQQWRNEKQSAEVQEESSQEDLAEAPSKEAQMRDRKERAETKRRIEQWKQRKIDQQRAEEEERERMIKEIREKDSSKVSNGVLRKKAVNEWKTKRKMDAQKSLMKKEIDHMNNAQKSVDTNRLLAEFRAQDEKYVARRREALTNRHSVTRQSLVRPAGASSHRGASVRDPQRLLRPTESSNNRVSRPQHSHNTATSHNEAQEAEKQRIKEQAKSLSVRNIPKLGVPTWRKEARNS